MKNPVFILAAVIVLIIIALWHKQLGLDKLFAFLFSEKSKKEREENKRIIATVRKDENLMKTVKEAQEAAAKAAGTDKKDNSIDELTSLDQKVSKIAIITVKVVLLIAFILAIAIGFSHLVAVSFK